MNNKPVFAVALLAMSLSIYASSDEIPGFQRIIEISVYTLGR